MGEVKKQWESYIDTLKKGEVAHSQVLFDEQKKRLAAREIEARFNVEHVKEEQAQMLGIIAAARMAGQAGELVAIALEKTLGTKKHEALEQAEHNHQMVLAEIKEVSREFEIAKDAEHEKKVFDETKKRQKEAEAQAKKDAETLKRLEIDAAGDRLKIVLQFNEKLAEAERICNAEILRKLAEAKRLALEQYDDKQEQEETARWEKHNKQLEQQDKIDAEVKLKDEKYLADQLAEITKERDEKEKKDREEALRVQREYVKQAEAIYGQLANSLGQAYGDALRSTKAFEEAQRASGQAAKTSGELTSAAVAKWVQDTLAGIAQTAAVKALFEVAESIADFATGNVPGGVAHAAAAAKFGAVAGVAGGIAYAVGQNRGLTSEEQSQVGGGSSASAGGATSGGARSAGGGGSQQVVKQIVLLPSSPFFTQGEAMAHAKRALNLADRLGYTGLGWAGG
jgi:hypothetical protein